MSNIENLTKRIIDFRDARDWKQFHNPKDVALSLSLEAAEVLEHFQWENGEELKEYCETHKEHIGEELADILDVYVYKAEKLEGSKDTVSVKFDTKNWVDSEVEFHYYEGTWQTIFENGVYKMLKKQY